MGLIEFTMGYISSIAVYARLSELNAPPVLCLILGLAAGLAIAFVLGYWLYACREKKKLREKRKKQHRKHQCAQYREYNNQSFRQNYERLGKRLGIEGKQEPEQNEPVRKVCGALSGDFAELSEDERRAFFEGVI